MELLKSRWKTIESYGGYIDMGSADKDGDWGKDKFYIRKHGNSVEIR